ncbi:MAG: divergent polysaccharide deacetylase family protein [Alphaproteobacteria bacterium]
MSRRFPQIIHPLGLLVVIVIVIAVMMVVEAFVVSDAPVAEVVEPSAVGNEADVKVEFESIGDVFEAEEFEALPQPKARKNIVFQLLKPLQNYPLVAEFNRGGQEEEKKPAPVYALQNTGSKKARIAIIIDDMGMNYPMTRAMSGVEGVPLTLAFLPYAGNLEKATKRARDHGHELIIHMPMEPMDGAIDTGPIALKDAMSKAEIEAMLDKAFAAFDGYKGLNNHMGSRLTQNSKAMGWVTTALRERGLFYVDSKTISTSVAAEAARAVGVNYAERDVFLDHEETPEFVRNALAKAERIALKKGYAIAIGHPKRVTYEALMAWLPSLKARGFEVVPVSELLLSPVVAAGEPEGAQGLYALNE